MNEAIGFALLVTLQVALYIAYFKIMVDGVDHKGWNAWKEDKYNNKRW